MYVAAHPLDLSVSVHPVGGVSTGPLSLRFLDARPEAVVARYASEDGRVSCEETRLRLPDDVLLGRVLLRGGPHRLSVFGAARAAEAGPGLLGIERPGDGFLLFEWRVGPRFRVWIAVATNAAGPSETSWAKGPARPPVDPRATPFARSPRGVPEGETAPSGPRRGTWLHFRFPPAAGRETRIAAAVAAEPGAALRRAEEALSLTRPLARVRAWHRRLLARMPALSSDDRALEAVFAHRTWLHLLHRVEGGQPPLSRPLVAEGPGRFHMPISFSSAMLLLDQRWMGDREPAFAALAAFGRARRPDGLPGGWIDPEERVPEAFYHAPWGHGLWGLLDALSPREVGRRRADLLRFLFGYGRSLRALLRQRRDPHTGMIAVTNALETGQEFSGREAPVDPDPLAAVGFEDRFRLLAADATTHAWRACAALARLARILERPRAAARWRASARSLRRSLLARSLDRSTGLFLDVAGESGQPTGVVTPASLLPYAAGMRPPPDRLPFARVLLDPRRLATPWPVATLDRQHALFDRRGRYLGVHLPCPWNGRVWAYANVWAIEALLEAGRRGDRSLLLAAARLAERTTDLHVERVGGRMFPRSWEHHDPFDGTPSLDRGVHEYLHTSLLDTLLRVVTGVRPTRFGLAVAPLPARARRVEVSGLRFRGCSLALRRDGTDVAVYLDGRLQGRASLGGEERIPGPPSVDAGRTLG